MLYRTSADDTVASSSSPPEATREFMQDAADGGPSPLEATREHPEILEEQ